MRRRKRRRGTRQFPFGRAPSGPSAAETQGPRWPLDGAAAADEEGSGVAKLQQRCACYRSCGKTSLGCLWLCHAVRLPQTTALELPQCSSDLRGGANACCQTCWGRSAMQASLPLLEATAVYAARRSPKKSADCQDHSQTRFSAPASGEVPGRQPISPQTYEALNLQFRST